MTEISNLSSDLTGLILSYLPIPTLIRASTVCRLWYSIISSPAFSATASQTHHQKLPWFFLYGIHNTSSKNNQSFAFDPLSNLWFCLPTFPSHHQPVSSCFLGADGFLLTTAPKFSYCPILKRSWHTTSPLRFSRINPLLGVFGGGSGVPRFIVVGGVRFIGNLVDIEDRLAVEIYNPGLDSWDLCPPLPADFRSGNSSQSLSSALFGRRFYVFGIYSCFISSFDLDKHVWSRVQTLRPPGVVFSFLISCWDRLVLAGICYSPIGPSFNLWKIDEETMEFSEIAIMPQDLLYSLFDSDEDDKFASLKCVGLGNLIYVFNEEYHRKYPACLCEISSESGKCSWTRVPQLPSPVNKFHKVISFCSTVSLQNILPGEEENVDLCCICERASSFNESGL
ncbi:F-box/kelch-repeat protein At3g24760 isoform X1 [Ziziphus jujuba]|uniref:F-box/kelch-repeat protein At3g24760 isoform X1 n=2 Tax=Ziziphus jujuba TaxID=326968 RepID=A0A6P4A8I4_ZIZJJ|nr:F-box/kelch-repeat protein At3g24760 isoform X1 [Ziziphus jujuba]